MRKRKKTDNENIEKGMLLLQNLILTSGIEQTLWASALMSTIVNGYKNCGFSYEQFCEEMERVKDHYKSLFDEK